MRVIKILVAVMAVLILVGIALVVYGLQRDKAARQAENSTAQTVNLEPKVPISDGAGDSNLAPVDENNDALQDLLEEPFGTINVDLVAGEKLLSFRVDGDRAFLHITGPKGARIVVVSMIDKSVLGQILLMKPN